MSIVTFSRMLFVDSDDEILFFSPFFHTDISKRHVSITIYAAIETGITKMCHSLFPTFSFVATKLCNLFEYINE